MTKQWQKYKNVYSHGRTPQRDRGKSPNTAGRMDIRLLDHEKEILIVAEIIGRLLGGQSSFLTLSFTVKLPVYL